MRDYDAQVQVAEGIHQLSQGIVNLYLIEDGSKLALVDAGAPGDWDMFIRTLGSLGRTLEDLECVVLTHAHSDHTGFAERARSEAHAVVRIHEASTFEDGETLDVPGRPRAVHAPGHSDGSCAIFFESRRVLLTGDALSTRNPLTGRQGPQIAPDGLNRDSERALRSLDALVTVPADLLLPGHGDPWTGSIAEAVRLARIAGRS